MVLNCRWIEVRYDGNRKAKPFSIISVDCLGLI